jgi:hypothetical protein
MQLTTSRSRGAGEPGSRGEACAKFSRARKNLKDLVMVQLRTRAFRPFSVFAQKPSPSPRLPVSRHERTPAPANLLDPRTYP